MCAESVVCAVMYTATESLMSWIVLSCDGAAVVAPDASCVPWLSEIVCQAQQGQPVMMLPLGMSLQNAAPAASCRRCYLAQEKEQSACQACVRRASRLVQTICLQLESGGIQISRIKALQQACTVLHSTRPAAQAKSLSACLNLSRPGEMIQLLEGFDQARVSSCTVAPH